LNETWDFNEYRTFGVNLGGWLVTEPFIVPNLYIPYQNATPQAVDEYTLSQALGDDLAEFMINHYETFITEEDFAQIAAAGMNWIRLPVPFWAVETVSSEPYLEGVAFNYMLQAFGEATSAAFSNDAEDFHFQNGRANTDYESSWTFILCQVHRTV
jgi:aryl-phospho-beta-D-glucosidase BglC (GH1 family)